MAYFDIRFVLLLIINIMKSHMAMPWEWDPFEVAADLTWLKFWLLTILFFVFSFFSVRIPLTSLNDHMGFIQVQIKNFSPSLLTCFLASLLLPQSLFWYVYPVILLLSLCHNCVLNMFTSFVFGVQALFSTIPNVNVFLVATDTVDANMELHEEEEGHDEGENLEELGSLV